MRKTLACETSAPRAADAFKRPRGDAPFVIEGSYLERRAVDVSPELDGQRMRFVGWSYPLEDYSRALERAGLLTEAIR